MLPIKSNTISVVIPSRGRVDMVKSCIDSIFKTASYPENVEVVLRVDDDDKDLEKYQQLSEIFNNVIVQLGPSLLGNIGEMWNEPASESTGNYILAGNDDLVFETQGWDEFVLNAAKEFTDDIFVIWCNDNLHGLCTFPIVSRRWYNHIGYLYPRCFKYCYPDTWVHELGIILDRCKFLQNVNITHNWVGRNPDETYRRSRKLGEGDEEMFKETRTQREADANRLRELMNV